MSPAPPFRAWVRSSRRGDRDPYRYVAACTCGWTSEPQDTPKDALPLMHDHTRTHEEDR